MRRASSIRDRIHSLLSDQAPKAVKVLPPPTPSLKPMLLTTDIILSQPETEEDLSLSPRPLRSYKVRSAAKSLDLSADVQPRTIDLKISKEKEEIVPLAGRTAATDCVPAPQSTASSSIISSEKDLETTICRMFAVRHVRLVPKPLPRRPPKTLLVIHGESCCLYDIQQ